MPVLSIHHYKENIKYRKETKRIFSIKIQPILILGFFMKKREIILTIGEKRHAFPAPTVHLSKLPESVCNKADF